MNKMTMLRLLFGSCFLSLSVHISAQNDHVLKHVDCVDFISIGKYHSEKGYQRLPQRYESKVRKEVWELSQNSAGISLRFSSDARTMKIKWTLQTNEKFPHMAWTGIAGLDVYVLQDDQWHFVETARPTEKTSEYLIFENKNAVRRDFLINLPLYDGVEDLHLLINNDATVYPPLTKKLLQKKGVAYYGSSIAQGACASRPGMAFTNILSRRLDRPVYNLGFSGEGTFEASIGEAMCEMDVELYVIDCNPNSDTSFIYERAVNLVKQLKACKPTVPVLLVENYIYSNDHAFPEGTMVIRNGKEKPSHVKWQKLSAAYQTLKKSGVKDLYYLEGAKLIGHDFEGTVDDSHPNDLGMMRMANELYPVVQKILNKSSSR